MSAELLSWSKTKVAAVETKESRPARIPVPQARPTAIYGLARNRTAASPRIERITGVEVSESGTELAPISGAVQQVFTTGTMVQVFLLAQSIPPDFWNGTAQVNPSEN